jgi:hypothetical protein
MHKRDRTREDRALKIESLVQNVDKKIADHRKKVADAKPKPGILSMIKRINLRRSSRTLRSGDQGQRRKDSYSRVK